MYIVDCTIQFCMQRSVVVVTQLSLKTLLKLHMMTKQFNGILAVI